MVAEIPEITMEDNAKKLADSIEQVSLGKTSVENSHELQVRKLNSPG
jgi:hypothetical protein